MLQKKIAKANWTSSLKTEGREAAKISQKFAEICRKNTHKFDKNLRKKVAQKVVEVSGTVVLLFTLLTHEREDFPELN